MMNSSDSFTNLETTILFLKSEFVYLFSCLFLNKGPFVNYVSIFLPIFDQVLKYPISKHVLLNRVYLLN